MKLYRQIDRNEASIYMQIIAQNTGNVNIILTNTPEKENKRPEIKCDKWTEHRKETQRVAEEKIKYISMPRYYRMRECGTLLNVEFCKDCGAYHVRSTNLCRDRFCPTCNWRLSLQRYADLSRLFKELYLAKPELITTFVTLTVQNCKPEELNNTMKRMSKAWTMTLKRRGLQRIVAGTARSVEVTYNKLTKTFHPHFHIMIVWNENIGNDETATSANASFISEWLISALRCDLKADIKAQHGTKLYGEEARAEESGKTFTSLARAITETFKYSFKSKQLDDMPLNVFRIFAEEFAGKRLVSFTGIVKEYAKLCNVNTEEVEENETKVCSECGSAQLDKIIYQWSFGTNAFEALTT